MKGDKVKIQYNENGLFRSSGLFFSFIGEVQETTDKIAKYLVKTFPSKFSLIEPTRRTRTTKAKEK